MSADSVSNRAAVAAKKKADDAAKARQAAQRAKPVVAQIPQRPIVNQRDNVVAAKPVVAQIPKSNIVNETKQTYGAKPVVAATPVVSKPLKTSTLGITEYPPNPNKNWSAVSKKYDMPEGYITATSDPTGSRNKAYLDSFGVDQPAPEVGAVDPFGAGGVEGLIASLRNSGGGGGGDTALDWAKWNAEQDAAAVASATSLRALQGLQGRLASGGYRGNADTLLGLINNQNTAGQSAITGNYNTNVLNTNNAFKTDTGYVNDIYNTGVRNVNDIYNADTGYANNAYNTAVGNTNTNYNTGVGNINSGYDTAQGMINSGYGDLNTYLNANQINPYANLQQQVGPADNAMANYLSAYGVSNDPVNQQVQASQMANQQGADSFNQLQQLMSANQQAGNQSNLDVSRMAQNYATTGLGSQRAGYLANADAARTNALNSSQSALSDAMYGANQARTSGLNAASLGQTSGLYGANQSRTQGLNSAESARMNAMNDLMNQIGGARYDVESGVGDRRTEHENAILAAGGSTSAIASDVNPGTGRVVSGPAASGPSGPSGSGATFGATPGATPAFIDGKPVVPGSAVSRAQEVATAPSNYPNFKAALAALNPNYKFTTMAAAKKKFPALAGKF